MRRRKLLEKYTHIGFVATVVSLQVFFPCNLAKCEPASWEKERPRVIVLRRFGRKPGNVRREIRADKDRKERERLEAERIAKEKKAEACRIKWLRSFNDDLSVFKKDPSWKRLDICLRQPETTNLAYDDDEFRAKVAQTREDLANKVIKWGNETLLAEKTASTFLGGLTVERRLKLAKLPGYPMGFADDIQCRLNVKKAVQGLRAVRVAFNGDNLEVFKDLTLPDKNSSVYKNADFQSEARKLTEIVTNRIESVLLAREPLAERNKRLNIIESFIENELLVEPFSRLAKWWTKYREQLIKCVADERKIMILRIDNKSRSNIRCGIGKRTVCLSSGGTTNLVLFESERTFIPVIADVDGENHQLYKQWKPKELSWKAGGYDFVSVPVFEKKRFSVKFKCRPGEDDDVKVFLDGVIAQEFESGEWGWKGKLYAEYTMSLERPDYVTKSEQINVVSNLFVGIPEKDKWEETPALKNFLAAKKAFDLKDYKKAACLLIKKDDRFRLLGKNHIDEENKLLSHIDSACNDSITREIERKKKIARDNWLASFQSDSTAKPEYDRNVTVVTDPVKGTLKEDDWTWMWMRHRPKIKKWYEGSIKDWSPAPGEVEIRHAWEMWYEQRDDIINNNRNRFNPVVEAIEVALDKGYVPNQCDVKMAYELVVKVKESVKGAESNGWAKEFVQNAVRVWNRCKENTR